jgi:hypothetical protein
MIWVLIVAIMGAVMPTTSRQCDDGEMIPLLKRQRSRSCSRQKAAATIARLGLDDQDCCRIRRDYFTAYVQDPTPTRQADLMRRAPFVWQEMKRQGMV